MGSGECHARSPVSGQTWPDTGDRGGQLRACRYNGPGNGDDIAASVAVSPDESTVFVTGSSAGVTSGADYATVAYNAASGAQPWASRYSGPGRGDDYSVSVAVSPNGRM